MSDKTPEQLATEYEGLELIDTGTAEFWDTGDRVVVVDDRMYRLDESESVAVQKD